MVQVPPVLIVTVPALTVHTVVVSELNVTASPEDAVALTANDPALLLIQRIRDEAHRFAVTYSRQRRSRRTITSQLLTIPGVGPDRRRKLLERFGSVAGVRTATREEIASLRGFSRTLAERILERLGST